MTQETIVNIVMNYKYPHTIEPGFNLTRWYIEKAVELTTKIILKDLFTYYENTQEREKTYY